MISFEDCASADNMWDKATDADAAKNAAFAEMDGVPKDQILQDKLAALGNKH